MSLVFALRSDNSSFNARVTPGTKTPGVTGLLAPTYEADVTAIGGNRFNLDRVSTAQRMLNYRVPGIFAVRARSLHVRIYFLTVAASGIVELNAGIGTGGPFRFALLMTSGTNMQALCTSEVGATVFATSTAWTPTVNTWYDLVLVWDGVTLSAGGAKIYIDGVATNITPASAWPTPFDSKWNSMLTVGIAGNQSSTRILINEINVWDEVIDPASVTLTSGSGALNGAARAAFVQSTAFEGGLYSDPGITNVKTGTAYTQAGVALTGTYAVSGAKNHIGPGRVG
jgi:hypothetical protein